MIRVTINKISQSQGPYYKEIPLKCEMFVLDISSAESQKGAIADQRCSIENQKGASAIDFVQQ